MLDHLAKSNGRRQACKKYSTQNTARIRKGKDQYGFEIFEERHKLDRDDKNGHHKKYRPKDNLWGILMLLPIQAPKTAAAGTSVDVGSFMYAALVGMQARGLGGKPLGFVLWPSLWIFAWKCWALQLRRKMSTWLVVFWMADR